MTELDPSQEFHQPTFPSFELDKVSRICQNPYNYIRNLAEKNLNYSDWLYSFSEGDFEVLISLDIEGDCPPTEIPPFVAVTVCSNSGREMVKTIVIYPHDPRTGETKSPWGLVQLPVTIFAPPPALSEIKWLSAEHQQAAQVALFIEDLIKNQAPTSGA